LKQVVTDKALKSLCLTTLQVKKNLTYETVDWLNVDWTTEICQVLFKKIFTLLEGLRNFLKEFVSPGDFQPQNPK
jgi:hypothetical protein